MSLNVKIALNTKQITRYLSALQKKQLPFATKNALNATAFDAMREEKKQLSNKLDRPTPFTIKSILVKQALKTRLVSAVYIRPKAWEYLKWQVEGGTRKPKGQYIPIPVQAKLNQYGNIKGRKRGPKGEKQFIKRVNNTLGVYEVTTKRTRLLIYYATQAKYSVKFPFYKIARRVGKKVFAKNFAKAVGKALATAK